MTQAQFIRMKKTTLGGIATAIAIVSVMASCQNKDDKGTAVKAAGSAPTSITEKIVYVNSDSLLTKYQYFKEIGRAHV